MHFVPVFGHEYTYSIFMQYSAHTSSLFKPTIHQSVLLQYIVVFHRSQSEVEIMKTMFVWTSVENYCTLWSNSEMNVCFKLLGGMCALFYKNRLGIKKSVTNYFTCFALSFKLRDSPPCHGTANPEPHITHYTPRKAENNISPLFFKDKVHTLYILSSIRTRN